MLVHPVEATKEALFTGFCKIEFLPKPEDCIVVGFGVVAPLEDACCLLDERGAP